MSEYVSNPCLNVENLTVRTATHTILDQISVSIPKNQVTVIIGPSGCGKSTLLKCMNRLIDFDHTITCTGSIMWNQKNIMGNDADLIEIRKKIGMILQTPNPLPMSIIQNVMYGLRIHGTTDTQQMNEITEQCLRKVNLWDEVKERLSHPASQLSIGQQQRLCLARTLAINPEIILCDETTSALDPISAKMIEEELTALKESYSIIFVTHILRQARRIADYVIFMYYGKIIEHGPKSEFFDNPKDIRTKEYIGGLFG